MAKEQLLHVEACDIGIAEGGARTHDLEVDLFAVNKSHTLYRLSYPGKGHDLMREQRGLGYKSICAKEGATVAPAYGVWILVERRAGRQNTLARVGESMRSIGETHYFDR
jgi:hypothetical protein